MEKLLSMLIEVSITMAIVILAMLLLKPLFKKRYGVVVRYFIWMFIMVRLLLPFNISFPKAIQIEVPTYQQAIVLPIQQLSSETKRVTPTSQENQPKIDSYPTGNNSPVVNNQESSINQSLSSWECLGIIWLIGCVISFLFHSSKYIYYAKKVKKTNTTCKVNTHYLMNEILTKYQSHASIQLYENSQLSSPMVMGFLKPIIIITDSSLPDNQQRIILEHEFIHYKRHDLLFKLGLLLAKCIHWFNPLVHIMFKEADKDIEFSCDEIILKDASPAFRKEYGNTILTILRSNVVKKPNLLTTSFNGDKKTIKERFSLLTDTSRKAKGVKIIFISLLSIILVASLVSCVKFEKINNVVSVSDKNNQTIYTFFNELQFSIDKKSGLTLSNVDMDSTLKEENVTFTLSYLNENKKPIDINMIIIKGKNDYLQHEKYDWIYFSNSEYKIYYEDTQEIALYGFKGKFDFIYKGLEYNEENMNKAINTCIIATVNSESDVELSYLAEYSEMVDELGVGIEILVDGIAKDIKSFGYKVNDDLLRECNIKENDYEYIGVYKLNPALIDELVTRLSTLEFSTYSPIKSAKISVDKVVYNENNKFQLEKTIEVFSDSYSKQLDDQKLEAVIVDGYREYRLENSNNTIIRIQDILDEKVCVSYDMNTSKLWIYLSVGNDTTKIPLTVYEFNFNDGGYMMTTSLPLDKHSDYRYKTNNNLVKVESNLTKDEERIFTESFNLLVRQRDMLDVDWEKDSR